MFVVRVKFKTHFTCAIVSAQRINAELLTPVVHRSAFVVLCKIKRNQMLYTYIDDTCV